MKIQLLFTLAVLVFANFSFAADEDKESDFLKSLNYPELEVTPLASETLVEEAKDERTGRWLVHAPIQVSAISTIMGSMNMAKVPDKEYTTTETDTYDNAVMFGNVIGYGWLVTTLALSASYRPYYEGLKDTKKYKGDSKKDKLARERIAERAMRRSAALGEKIKWMSFWSNIIANTYMAAVTSRESVTYPAVGVLLSFAPLVFEYHWTDIYREHQNNKKKIYGPVARMGIVTTPDGKEIAPGLNLSLSF